MKLGLGVGLFVVVAACAPDWDNLDPSFAMGGGGGEAEGQAAVCAGVSANSLANFQTPGDCRVLRCDDLGNAISAVDSGDVPPSEKECWKGTCEDDKPTWVPEPYGTSCGNKRICDKKGTCVKCSWNCD
jgi:hypothetical protein